MNFIYNIFYILKIFIYYKFIYIKETLIICIIHAKILVTLNVISPLYIN